MLGQPGQSLFATWVPFNSSATAASDLLAASAAPQTKQIASPVCGNKNFSSERLYFAPQLHCTTVTMLAYALEDLNLLSATTQSGPKMRSLLGDGGECHQATKCCVMKGQCSFRSSSVISENRMVLEWRPVLFCVGWEARQCQSIGC